MTVVTETRLIVLDTETTGKNPHTCNLLGHSFCEDNVSGYTTKLPCLEGKELKVICHNGKYDKIVLDKTAPFNVYWDTMVAEYLLHINESVGLKEVFTRRFKESMKTLVEVYNEATGEKRVNLPEDWYEKVPQSVLADYAKRDAENTYKLYLEQVKEFASKPDLYSWFTEIEMPLVNILAEMEIRGVQIDAKTLLDLEEKLLKENKVIINRLLVIANNKELNLNSPKQLIDLLYTKFNLPVLERTKTGQPSTDKGVLERLAKRHLFPRLLRNYRTNEKIISTYTRSIVKQQDTNGKIHTNFNQCLTKTRRFSSDHPNIQNITRVGNFGSIIRSSVIPSEGNKLLIFDYSQIELRLLAHFSGEPSLIEVFEKDGDVHQDTADSFSKQLNKVYSRDYGKTFNFSLIYGKTKWGFSEDWGCSLDEASSIIDAYFLTKPLVKKYMDNEVRKCKLSGGWLKSLAGLPLYVEYINSSDKARNSHAKRCAQNTNLQASSQDVLKKAIVTIKKTLNKIPVFMVHDEVIYDEPEEECDTLIKEIVAIMESVFTLKVPLKVSSKIADRWEK